MKKNIIGLLVLVLFVGVVGSLLQQETSVNVKHASSQFGDDFELQSVDGAVKLSDFSDKTVLLFFGYTNCPDVCPVTLANVSRAMKMMGPEKAEQLQMIFVSLDPKRDTVEHLNNYAQFFNENFIGLTGSKESLDTVVMQYGAVYRITEMNDSAIGYSVDHSTKLYLIDKNRNIAHYFSYDSSPVDIAAKITQIL